ncbi:DinB family protein [Reichenbachiella sp.]|uniref:DinB family protein n=1 Tax=Reichenbachiella sp. TaxID=2184521 RepID=UPI003BAEF210
MNFTLAQSIEILERTPDVLDFWLKNLSDDWVRNNEGEDTWSAFDIVGHLIHGEQTDWMVRMEMILSDNTDKSFEPFDRFAQFKKSKGKSLEQLLTEFKILRKENLERLSAWHLSSEDLQEEGIHPTFGKVTLQQLLSAWVVHDLNHLSQISRVMAMQYKEEVGPWVEFLGVLKR